MFYFQTMFQQVYNGITGSAVLPAVQQIAEAILLLAALFAVYEAYAKGGDARTLALAGVRYLIMGLLITQYPNVFRNVNNAFANVAQAIAPTDVWTNFRDQVQGYMSANNGQGAWWNWVVGGVAGAFSLIFQAIAVLVFPISYAIFSFFYSMYGAVLYVVGPLVLALYPALGVGQLARTFMVNLMVWNAWGLIYAIISQLLTIMSANSLNSIFTSQSFGGAFQGASQMLLISLSSILLSIMILLIPFIAKRVVSGDIGSTMLTVAGVAAAAAQTAIAGWAGMQGGAASAGGGGDGGGGGGGGGGFLTPMVGQIIRLHHRLTEIMPLWVVRLRRLGTLRSHLVMGLWGTRAVPAVAALPPQPATSGHRTIRRGSPTADQDTSGITTSRTQSDGRWEPGQARRAGR